MTTDPRRDDDAEQAVLGALLLHPPAVERAGTLGAEDFFHAKHAKIFTAIRAVVDAADSSAVDHLNVMEELQRSGDLARVGAGPYLHELIQSCPTTAQVPYYARRVQEAALRRRVARIGEKLAEVSAGADLDDALTHAAELLVDLEVSVETNFERSAPIEGLSTVAEFVDAPSEDYDWVIPGVLERMDRVIVVASEGAGKSTLARQVAIMLAAGIHPFDPGQAIPAMRTLIVDLENPPALVRRKLRRITDPARQTSTWRDQNAFRWTRPGGLNLRRHSDQRLFDRVLSETRPALVALGPLYKAFVDDGARSEQTASELSAFLDRMREKHRVAYWLEAHAPLDQMGQRSLRPMGSGLWSRWPEFGLALRKANRHLSDSPMVVEYFRGNRDERTWPLMLKRGNRWPWIAVSDPVEADAVLKAAGQ